MSARHDQTIHGSAVLVGDRAVLIRGPSGSGKSRLAFDLILAGRSGQIPAATLVGDDRLHLARVSDRLVVRPPPELAGLIEIRGLGIRRCAFAAEAPLGLVVDLSASDAERLPPQEALEISLLGVQVPRVPIGTGFSPLPPVVAALTTTSDCRHAMRSADCRQEFGNHISPTIATE
ncbi:MAG TPA: HPr kinase/phosphatase C-terminal domain-containing protein [Nitrobacter sp.]|jgi:serine kinase of HPr protein (carbohydrate metabolism regulator)|nr:HPr kinase/phosphatase C-terminal domain-containing protein [Nitrobacter sp.]